MSMPSGVQYGRVTGRLIRAVLDGSDGDESPDGAPIPGATVTFRARVRHAKKASAEPPVTIFLDPVIGSYTATVAAPTITSRSAPLNSCGSYLEHPSKYHQTHTRSSE